VEALAGVEGVPEEYCPRVLSEKRAMLLFPAHMATNAVGTNKEARVVSCSTTCGLGEQRNSVRGGVVGGSYGTVEGVPPAAGSIAAAATDVLEEAVGAE
jgi:hypothetical protein